MKIARRRANSELFRKLWERLVGTEKDGYNQMWIAPKDPEISTAVEKGVLGRITLERSNSKLSLHSKIVRQLFLHLPISGRIHRLNIEIARRKNNSCFEPRPPYLTLLWAQSPLSAGLSKRWNCPQKEVVKQQNAKHLRDGLSNNPRVTEV